MLGSRTKQVNSYGRRGSRIVNISDRRDPESVDSHLDAHTSHQLRPLERENAVIIPPTKYRVGLHKSKGSSRSPRGSPLVQNKPRAIRNAAAKRIQATGTQIRQPLTPLRPNGTLSIEHPSKGKFKALAIKPARASLKPHVPVIAVDIIVLDEEGKMLTQERRLSHTEVQADQVCNALGKGRKYPPSQPIAIGDDSDSELDSPRLATKRWNRRLHAVVISSDESEDDDKGTVPLKFPVPLPQHSRSGSRVEVVIPPASFRRAKVSKKASSPPPIAPKIPAQPVPRGTSPAVIPSYLVPSVPIPKPRQLTPIRGSSSRSLFRRPPPTPSTPTEADLSLDLAQLDLSDAAEVIDLASAQPKYLVPLLNVCAQASPYEFSAFIETFPFDPIVQSSEKDEDARFRKIGEASYSEVFGIGDVVLKIIPVRLEGESMHPESAEMPASSDANDILKEILVTREIGEICDKFVKLLKTYVVRGRYPSLLLDLWDEFNEKKGSESVRPANLDSFGLTQVYTIIILPNGGPDLESFVFKNVSKSGWHQACGVFWQVARALEQAEHLVHFEHRDLHWGQILVKNVPVKKLTSKCPTSRIAMDDTRFGVKVTIIDLGLSRMTAADTQGSKTYWTPFDEEIFEGEGDYQHDVYRMMRDVIGGAWKAYRPFTNVMWLHYLVTKLLREKRLKLPGGQRQTGVSPTGYDEQECHDCLADMERLLGGCIASARKGQKSRRKTVVSANGPKSARDVIAYGMRQGWVH